jgi:hypothetical protein
MRPGHQPRADQSADGPGGKSLQHCRNFDFVSGMSYFAGKIAAPLACAVGSEPFALHKTGLRIGSSVKTFIAGHTCDAH